MAIYVKKPFYLQCTSQRGCITIAYIELKRIRFGWNQMLRMCLLNYTDIYGHLLVDLFWHSRKTIAILFCWDWMKAYHQFNGVLSLMEIHLCISVFFHAHFFPCQSTPSKSIHSKWIEICIKVENKLKLQQKSQMKDIIYSLNASENIYASLLIE